MSSTAAGGKDGIVASGPTNKYDGFRDPGIDGNTDVNFAAVAPCDTFPAPVKPAGWALGSVPD